MTITKMLAMIIKMLAIIKKPIVTTNMRLATKVLPPLVLSPVVFLLLLSLPVIVILPLILFLLVLLPLVLLLAKLLFLVVVSPVLLQILLPLLLSPLVILSQISLPHFYILRSSSPQYSCSGSYLARSFDPKFYHFQSYYL